MRAGAVQKDSPLDLAPATRDTTCVRAVALLALLTSATAWAGPETALREFSSSQIKKGVRALGMGGNGATVGNYSLVYRDAGGALADYGNTYFYDTGNDVQFVAVGFTTPPFWKDAAFYIIAMSAWGSDLRMHLRSPAFAAGADFRGEASDQAVFAKFAKKLPRGFAVGGLFGWERSALSAAAEAGTGNLTYTTVWLPSGGAGVSWENRRLLVGVRALLSNDWETRRDPSGSASGWLRSWEFRAGVAVKPWRGAIVDCGYVGLWRSSAVDKTGSYVNAFVLGFEQEAWRRHLWLRAGWNESAPTVGLSARVWPFKLDVAYVHDLGIDRSNAAFGHHNDAVFATLNYEYLREARR